MKLKISEFNIITQKTARYYSNRPDSVNIEFVWFVLHGYAQLAKDFVKEFDFLNDNNTLIVAPEGLSKFYFRNNVGASWMTKEDRLNDINDYLNYLNLLFDEIGAKYNLSKAKFNLLGFSQGVHTAVRWFVSTNHNFDRLLLCSSDFPKDADFDNLKNKLQKSKMYFIYGNKDDVIGKQTFQESVNLLRINEVGFDEIVFEGKHTIDKNSISVFK